MRVSGLLVLCVAALVACDEKEGGSVNVNERDSGDWPDARIGGGGGGNREGGVIPDAQLPDGGSAGPAVELKNLSPLTDPLAGPPIVGSSLEVICEAKQRAGGTPVDLSSVMVQLFDTKNEKLDEAPLTSQGVDTFKGSVSLSQVPTGPVTVRCVATDTTTPTPLSNFNQIGTFYDGGPKIVFDNLNDMSIVPRGDDKKNETEFTIKFTVEPSPLITGDSAAAVQDVKLLLRDELVTPTRDGNVYSYPVDFKTLVGNTPISELKVNVSATNARSPVAATSTHNVVVKVDSKPPTIIVSTPSDGDIVGGRVTAQLTITDDLSGVSSNSLLTFATLGDGESKKKVDLQPVDDKPGSYTFDFEAAKFPGIANIPINITAVDNVGNSTIKSLGVKFDTVPPWVSLASPLVRECTKSTGTCSGAFKALGNSPQDGDTIFQEARFRMLIWERGIITTGAEQIWISKVDDSTVALYAQSNRAYPLVIDTNEDRICDTLDDDLAHGVVRHGLAPMQVFGTLPSYNPSTEPLEAPAFPSGWGALSSGQLPYKCSSEMSYAISQALPERPTAVYAREADIGGRCGGISFSLGTATPGWTCIVGAATDRSGNVGISMPIRVCRKPAGPEGENVDCTGAPPENLTCTDGCTMPEASSKQLLKLGSGEVTVHLLADGVFVY